VPVDWNTFREAMRRFATGVAILTVRDGEMIHGMTANAFASVSKDPMLVLVCVMKDSLTHAMVSRTRNFALNVLSAHQRPLAQRFAKQVTPPLDPFSDISYHRAVTGAPIFEDCASYVDCRVVAAHDGGDHTIFIGQVEAAGMGASRDKLLLWVHGDYHAVE